MHLCICGKRLFPGQSSRDIMNSNKKGRTDLHLHASNYLSPAGLDFLSKLLAREPNTRPSAQDALGHEWFDEEYEEKAVKVSGMSGMSKIGSCDENSCGDNCYDNQCDNDRHIRHDKARHSEPGSNAESSKHSVMPLFKGFLRRRAGGRASTLTKIVPIPSVNSFQGHDSASGGSSHKALASQKHFFCRASKALAWIRGAREQQGYAVEKDIHVQKPGNL